jgi:PAS domain S-box-containing protein
MTSACIWQWYDTIAASNWDTDASLIGTNYAERDWFRANQAGKPGMQYAMGKTTYLPGLYFSSPVIQNGHFSGAVVVKLNVENLSFLTAQTNAYLTDEFGVVILAQDKSLEFQAVPNAAVFGLSAPARLARYQHSDFTRLDRVLPDDVAFPELYKHANDTNHYLQSIRSLPEYGLTVHVEDELQLVALQRERWLWLFLLVFIGSTLILSFNALYIYLSTIRSSRRVLRDSEERLNMLLKSAPDAVFIWGSDECIVYVNDATLQLLGYAVQELIGKKIFDLAPVDWRESYRQEVNNELVRKEHSIHEVRLLTKDGRQLPMEANVVRLPNGQVYGSCRDITEREQVKALEQQRLDEMEALYQLSNAVTLEQIYTTAMDYIPRLFKADRVAIMLSDDDGIMRLKAWRGLSDSFLKKIDGNFPPECVASELQPTFAEDIEHDEQSAGMRDSLRAEGIKSISCMPLQQHDHLFGKLSMCFDNPHHFSQREKQLAFNIAAHVSSAIDRKYVEQQFSDMFEFAPDAIVITDMQAIITMLNRQAEALFGYNKDELIGRSIDILIPHDTKNERRNMRQRFLNSALLPKPMGETSRKDLRAITKDDRIFPVEISLSPMRSQNGMVIAAAVRDVSARKQVMEQLMFTARELEQANAQVEEERAQLAFRVEERTLQLRIANRAKDSFLATMSHEIRTPLGGLLGMMELLSLTSLDAEQVETLQAARSSGKGLLRIVDDILDWSKIEAGKLQLSPRAAPIAPLLKGVVATYGQLASTKGIQLRYRYDESLSQAHLFDHLRLSQILNNFTSNAIKFTASGSVEISATLVAQQNGCEEVRFCVKDTGIGLEPAQLARLFQQYEQASSDTARMYGGTGLGLAICRSLAELMEGNISVTSTHGVGSEFCFTVCLPVANLAAQRDLQLHLARGEEGELQVNANINTLRKSGKAVSVLVVDDHPVNRMLLKQQLEQLGLHGDVAAYGILALALWQTGQYDLVITDCHMPEMDGYELTRCIRDIEVQDELARTPIVAWTANVMAEEEGRCKAAGMDDILTKPTELAQLRAMLLKWLDRPELVQQDDEVSTCAEPDPNDTALTPASGKVLELSALQKIAKRRAQQIEMLQEFTAHNRNDIAALAAALQAGNPAAVARGAHRIKGACRMVGALQLEALCSSIEQAASFGDMSSARTLAKGLYEANTALEHAVARFIDAHEEKAGE